MQHKNWSCLKCNEKEFEVGEKYSGTVQNLTQFGAFVELKEGIDGLVHVSDLSWTKVVRHAKNVVEKTLNVFFRNFLLEFIIGSINH